MLKNYKDRSFKFALGVMLLVLTAFVSAHAQQVPGQVAAYGFEEGSGQATADSSGLNNRGAISGATWVTSGKVGGALSFDGANDMVSVADSASLDLTAGMTLEAWVYPTALADWHTVVMKETNGELVYALYASENVSIPSVYVRIGNSSRRLAGTSALPLNTWTHLAATYTGSTLRLYVNGTQVASQARTGSIATSNQPVRIGGNAVWGEYFNGSIDEVRIYNRALTVAEIAADMAAGTGPIAPKLAITSPANGASITGTTLNVAFSSSGDTSQASNAYVQLDGGTPKTAPLSGQLQFTNVAAGAHSISGYLVHADQTKIVGSDAVPVVFTAAALAPPKLTITAPSSSSVITGTTVNVAFASSGDLSEAAHVHFTLDAGPEMMVMTLNGQLQLVDVAAGVHSLSGYLARADHSKISGSDASVTFSTTSSAGGPRLTITSPTDNATVIGSNLNVSFATSGDLAGASHVHLQLDGGPELQVNSLNGVAEITGLSAGIHRLDGYVARTDHAKIAGSDAATVHFTTSIPSADDPLLVGQWASNLIDLPTVAVDLILLHTGKAIFWAGDFSSAPNYGELWDPATNLITPAPNPFSNIFCSAHVHLPNGRVLVAGGHDKQNGILGLAKANTFDPVTESWSALPSMSFRRWYPTLTALGDGRAIVTSGSEDTEGEFVDIPEIYDPVTNTWTRLNNARLSIPQYPMMYLLPDGRLLQSGTTEYPTPTRVLNIATQQWSEIDSRVLEGGSGVMYAPGKIMKSGSASNDGGTPTALSTATTYVIDMNAPSPAWRQTQSMHFPRTFHNLTSLADGSVLVTSGSQRKSETNLTPAVLEAELWSPDTETWTTMTPMRKGRIYHSTAVLLPDGRVAVSGSGNISGATDQTTLEIFSPPYLFKGPRPTVTSVPTLLQYGAKFVVQTPNAADIRAVNLLRPGAATHNFDQDQRFVPLSFTQVPGGIEVQATSNPNMAPPGYYMLFLVTNAGVPSVAKFVRFPAPYEDAEPPTAPSSLSGSGSVGTSTLIWNAATDNVGVVRYDVHRSTVSGFTPSAATLVGSSPTTNFTDSGLGGGTYYYVVVAVDATGSTSVASNQIAISVASDTTAPTVSLTNPAAGATLSGTVTLSAIAQDNVGIAGVQFRLDGAAIGSEDTSAPYSLSWNSAAAANGAHELTAIARDSSNNAAQSSPLSVTVSNSTQAPSGLIASYSFDEGSGQSVSDGSGRGHVGAISGATWTTAGKVGGALSFDGVNDLVTIADSAALDLTTGMTLEAWIYPTALGAGWRTVLMKEFSGELTYTLYANEDVSVPAGYVRVGTGSRRVGGSTSLPLNGWTHLASTYDGSTLRLFVNGVQVGSQAVTGPIATSTLPLRIGGNTVWGEYFSGRIDEVRVYNRALTAAEIVTDMNVGTAPAGARLTITGPANNASISGSTVNVTYVSSGDLIQASSVRLRLDGGAEINATALTGQVQLTNMSAGTHTLTGYLARSDQSKIEGSDAALVTFTTVLTQPVQPKLSITAPANNGNITGTTVQVSYSSTGDVAQAAFAHFSLDGGSELVVTALNGEFQIEAVGAGSHTLQGYLARADHSKITGSDATAVAFATVLPDTTRPAVVITAPRDGDTVSGAVTLTATAQDNVAVGGVQFKLDGTALGGEDVTAPYSLSWNTSIVANGAHVLTAVARDASNNTTESLSVNVIVSNAAQVPAGLVAAYGFEEGTGQSAADISGRGHVGTISGASWTTAGKFGNALSFDGVNDLVTVADSAALDLTTGMTLEAWVYPTALSGWRTVLMKEVSGELAYTIYANDQVAAPASYVRIGSTSRRAAGASALPLNAWTHVAATYDGATLRLYVNGSQVGSQAVTGAIAVSALPLRIGGNNVWGEYFSGRIDEVRVYNRALSAAEIATDMNLAVVRVSGSQPTRSSSILVDAPRRRVWTVNPDSDSVTALDADTYAVRSEVAVGRRPTSIALDNAGQIWVTCRDDDSIWVLDAATGAVKRTLTLAWGSAPVSVVFTPAGSTGFVALQGKELLQRIDPATQALGATLAIGPMPRALAITADGKRLLVTQFVSSGASATVRSIDVANFAAGLTLALPLDTTSIDGSVAARGLPNYLAGIAIDPADGLAWVVANKDNIVRGSLRSGQPLTFETTVRAMVGRLDLKLNQEQVQRRIDVDNSSQPSAVLLSDTGALAFVTLQGNNRVVVLNQLGAELARADTGLAPQGVALDPTTKRVFTQDFMSRSVSVFDAKRLLEQGLPELNRVAQVTTVAREKLSAPVLRGKQIFYNAADTRMSREGYLSCASCHLDGEHDGQVWDFTDRGEGLRNTISLKGQGGNATAPLHWSGNFDEVQDFENDIRSFFGGTGFLSDTDFNTGTRAQPLGDRKTGLSPDLDALAAYVNSLTDSGRSPHRQTNGAMTPGGEAGKVLFEQSGCQTCHSGARFTDSSNGVRHDVGTIKPSSGQRAGALLDGLDTPTLVALWGTAPYLHDGSAAVLRDVPTTANPVGTHGNLSTLSPTQIDQLVEYLLQLESGSQ